MKQLLSTTSGRLGICWILIVSSCTFSLTIEPDSVSAKPGRFDFKKLTTISLKNLSGSTIVVDSIYIRFQNGDSSDFRVGSGCQTSKFMECLYNGWVYGYSMKSLRYLHDSLYVLQDSAGNVSSVSIAPDGSVDFDIYPIVNCPFCARMPLLPKTTEYLYIFHTLSGGYDTLFFYIDDQTYVKRNRIQNRQKRHEADKEEMFDLTGRPVNMRVRNPQRVVIARSKGVDKKCRKVIKLSCDR